MNQPEDLNTEARSADLERELTEALRPIAPPEGFAERVVSLTQPSYGRPARVPAAAIDHAKVVIMKPHSARSARLTGAIAATLIAGVFFAQQTHVRHRREQAELAQRQFEAAISITGQALDHTRAQLRRAGIRLGN